MVRSCKESANRENEMFKMSETMADDGKVEDCERQVQGNVVKQDREEKKMKNTKPVHFWTFA